MKDTFKKILITLIVGALSFTAGLAGIYAAMPALAPERVQEARARVDSLLRAPRVEAAPAAPADPPATDFSPEVMRDADTLPTPAAGEPGPMPPSTLLERTAILEDSLRQLLQELAESEQDRSTLRTQLEEMRRTSEAAAAQRVEAGELSSTLARLEDDELRALLQKLDAAVLEILYAASSGRTRTRLLQAMNPDHAARFVENLIQSGRHAATPVSFPGEGGRTPDK